MPAPQLGRRTERATTLVLVPAMALVLVSLAAIGLDLSLVHAVHRDAHRVASVAADDAAGMLDEEHLQTTGETVIDEVRARRVVDAHLRTAELAGELHEVRVEVGTTTVDVQLTVEVPRVFLSALPGADDAASVVVRARGRLLT